MSDDITKAVHDWLIERCGASVEEAYRDGYRIGFGKGFDAGKQTPKVCGCVSPRGHTFGCTCGCFEGHVCRPLYWKGAP